MLPLVINNEKYLTLNLSRESNFIFIFLVKSYTTFIGPNLIGKVAKKKLHFYYKSIISEPDIKF